MGSIDTPLRWEKWVEDELTEKRPAPLNLTDTERFEWFAEYCDRYEYIRPGHIITDCDGQKTIAASFRDAIDAAAAKWKEVNE